jgi:hypothetical protein
VLRVVDDPDEVVKIIKEVHTDLSSSRPRACALVRAWHDSYVPFLVLIVGLVILVAVVLVAAGRGGELSAERNDYAPLDLGPVSATDVALMRPPSNAWGYNMQATDEALEQIAESIRERDVRIVALEQLVTDLSREPAPPPLSSPYAGYIGARRRRELPEAGQPAEAARAGEAGQAPQTASPGEVTWSAETAWAREASRPTEMAWPASPTRPDPAQSVTASRPEAQPPGAQPPEAQPTEAGRPEEAGQPAGEGQVGPPERSHG